MSRIYPIHWKKFEEFLLFVGCSLAREKGDHRIYYREDLKRPVIIPKDSSLPIFVIRNNLRTLNILPEEYSKILEQL